jgi:hypothetical protein
MKFSLTTWLAQLVVFVVLWKVLLFQVPALWVAFHWPKGSAERFETTIRSKKFERELYVWGAKRVCRAVFENRSLPATYSGEIFVIQGGYPNYLYVEVPALRFRGFWIWQT